MAKLNTSLIKEINSDYNPPVQPLQLGSGEARGGYQAWCAEREWQAPQKYHLRRYSKLLFSIIVPVHNPQQHWIEECIESVRSQFFADWELILADDASEQNIINSLKRNQSIDKRIKLSLQTSQSGISATTNHAAALAKGDFLLFLDHDDILDPYALSAFAQRLKKKPDTDILYSDEDRFDENYQRLHPGFKPQFSLEKFLCTNYIHHPVVMRRTLFETLGGFNSKFDGSQDYDLLLRAIEVTSKVEHIPDVLYHMRLHSGSLSSGAAAKPEAHDRGKAAVQAYLQRQKSSATISPTPFDGCHNLIYPIKQRPKTSILLLVNADIKRENIKPHWQQYKEDEILICNNDSVSIPVRLNALAHKAQGELLIFADGQLQPEADCIDRLLSHCLRKNTGLVTGKLSYSDARLQSCGLILGIQCGAGFWHHGCSSSDLGYGGWMGLNHEVSAVPWQLMAVKKQLFMQAGLFNEQYTQHGFDIHLALQISSTEKVKHLTVSLAKAVLPYPCPAQIKPWQESDFMLLWTHWQKKLNHTDPCYNPNFSIYDESINFIDPAELYLKNSGLFNAYDKLTHRLLWQLCH